MDVVLAKPFQALAVTTTEVPIVDLNEEHDVLTMACTPPSAILSRLDGLAEAADNPPLRMDVEYEKKQWMLSVLQHLDARCGMRSRQQPSCKQQAMLVLHESQGMQSTMRACRILN